MNTISTKTLSIHIDSQHNEMQHNDAKHNNTVITTLSRTLFTVTSVIILIMFMLSVVFLIVIILIVFMLCVDFLSVIILIVFMLSVVFLNVILLLVVAPIFEVLRSKNNSIETAKTSKQLKNGQNLLKFLKQFKQISTYFHQILMQYKPVSVPVSYQKAGSAKANVREPKTGFG